MNCKIGDIVFILGRYIPCGPTKVIACEITHIKHRQFVAYDTADGMYGEFHFSKKNYGKTVFATREAAEKVLKEQECAK